MISRIRVASQAPDRFNRLKDYVWAKALFSLPRNIRRRLYVGGEFYCPICKSRLNRFLVLHRAYHLWCPVCRSLQRHRLLWLLVEQEGWLKCSPENPLQLLHFAPESCLEEKFRQTTGINYLSADLYNRHAMIKADLVDLRFESESFDLIFCSHVLEHITDDHKAISEINRILRPGGRAVIIVPIRGETTVENLTITNPLEREKLLGQLDHVRVYGKDFPQRLERVGFSVQTLTITSLKNQALDLDRMGLNDRDIVFNCRK